MSRKGWRSRVRWLWGLKVVIVRDDGGGVWLREVVRRVSEIIE